MKEKKKYTDESFRKMIREGVDLIAILNPDGTYNFVSPTFESILGYEADELIGKNAFELIHPEDTERVFEEFLFYKTNKKEKSSPYRFRKKNGSYIWLQSFGTNLLDDPDVEGIVVNTVDVTESHYYNRLDKLERKILEKNVTGESLVKILKTYTEGIEDLHPGMLCSVQKVEGNQLFNLVSPNLPKTYLEAIEGMEICENQGACGTAVYLGEKVIIAEAENDERTSKFLDLVENYQFKGLWSYPVKDENQDVIATFAAYYHEPREPGGYEENTIERAAKMTQVILKNHRTVQALNESNMRFKYANKATEEVIYEHDLEGETIKLSDNFEKIFGYTFAEDEFTLEKWATNVHPDDRDEINPRLEASLKNRDTNKWTAEFRYARKDGTYAHIVENSYILRDNSGKAVRMIGAVRDVTDRKNREMKQKLITKISHNFNETEGVRGSLKKSLNEFKGLGNFALAEIWLTSIDKKTIDLAAALDKNVETFHDSSEEVVSFKSGTSLPGKTWKSGKFQFWKNLDKRNSFFGRETVIKAGLKTAYGIPITNKEEVIGVLVLGVKENVSKPHLNTSILEELADRLGEEIKRKELEEELARLFTSAPDGIAVAGFDGFFKKVNPAMCEMLGYTESELLAIPFIELIHPDDKEETLKQFEAIEQKEAKHFYENRYITKSGKVLWLAWSSKILVDEEVAYSVVKNITKEKELENLHEQATRLAKIGSWDYDLVEDTIYWSDITREIHEVEPEFVPDFDEAFRFYKKAYRQKLSDAVQEAIDNGTSWDLELKINTAKGKEKWIRAIGEAEMVNGECVRLYGSFQDIHQRKEAELALQEAFDKKNEILESIGDAFFALDKNWTVTYWNHMAEEVLGMPREEILGENLWDLYEDATSLEFYTQYHKAVNEQVTVHFEEYYPTLEKWFEVSAYPSSSGLSVYFKDITERKRNQEKLLEKTRQLDAIARFNSLLIKKEHWLEALDECLEMFGKVAGTDRVYYFECHKSGSSDEHVISMRVEWVKEGIKPELDNPVHHDLPLTEVSPITEVLTGRETYNRVVNEIKDSEFKEFLQVQEIKSILAIPVFTGDTFRGFIGFDDCTKERTWREEEITFLETISINLASALENEDAETALQEAFDEKNEILESIGDGFFTLDKDFLVTYWNQKAEELLLTPKEKVLGKYLWDVFDKDLAFKSYINYSKALEKKYSLKFEDYYEPIGRWFDVNVYPSEHGISIFFKDITERKKADEKLRELNQVLEKQTKELATSNAELEQFAFVASHDLQEPLRMITGFLAQLEKKYDPVLDEKGRKYIHFATDGARRMRQVILDLLEFSRVGRVDTEREVIDMNQLVEDVISLNKKLITENNAKVEFDELQQIIAARGPMRQLFQNLVNNAVKYQEKGSTPVVKISSGEDEKYWHFKIQDNGIGINEEYREKIFNIFQRLHGKEEYSGSGVGLAICKKIVEDHGGEISVDSEEGAGSTFHVSIAKKHRELEI